MVPSWDTVHTARVQFCTESSLEVHKSKLADRLSGRFKSTACLIKYPILFRRLFIFFYELLNGTRERSPKHTFWYLDIYQLIDTRLFFHSGPRGFPPSAREENFSRYLCKYYTGLLSVDFVLIA